MGLFGKSPGRNPKEMVNEWSHKLRKEGYNLDRQIRAIQREEDKIKVSLKQAAAKNDKQLCLIYAKEIVNSRRATKKIYTAKAHLNSVQMQMKNQLATLRVAGSLAKSTEVMQAMQKLVRVRDVAETMRELSKEMMKAGIIEEMLDETMSFESDEEMEQEAQSEIDKVIWEVTQGKLGEAPAPPTAVAPAAAAAAAASTSKEEEEEQPDETELDEMQTRLEALRS